MKNSEQVGGKKNEAYTNMLDRITVRAHELFPETILYNQAQAAIIMGVSTRTLSRRGVGRNITAEKLARVFC